LTGRLDCIGEVLMANTDLRKYREAILERAVAAGTYLPTYPTPDEM